MKKIKNSINSELKNALKTSVISLLSLVLFWAFRFASGFPLYLCSLSFHLARKNLSPNPKTHFPSPKLVPETLAKDAAPIPNAPGVEN